MFWKKHFISMLAGLAACGACANAQSYFHSLNYHARIEKSDPIIMQIGAESGRAYFRALNSGPGDASARIFIERIANEKTGELERFIHMVKLGPYGAGETIYLDELSAGKSWVTGWEAAAVSEAAAKAPDREAIAFYRMPPRYPEKCMDAAEASEHVTVNYDVTAQGEIEHIIIRDVTDGCFAMATHQLVSQWRFAPKIVRGEPVVQTGLETVLTYMLTDE